MTSPDFSESDSLRFTPGPRDGDENIRLISLPLEIARRAIMDFQPFEVISFGGIERPDPARSRLDGRHAKMVAFFTAEQDVPHDEADAPYQAEHYISYSLPGGRIFKPKPDAVVYVTIDVSGDPKLRDY